MEEQTSKYILYFSDGIAGNYLAEVNAALDETVAVEKIKKFQALYDKGWRVHQTYKEKDGDTNVKHYWSLIRAKYPSFFDSSAWFSINTESLLEKHSSQPNYDFIWESGSRIKHVLEHYGDKYEVAINVKKYFKFLVRGN